MAGWVLDVLSQAGYWGIALLMLLETVFPPIPSEFVMPLAGYLAADGTLSLWGVTMAGTAGTVAGALLLYALGRGIPRARLKTWADRHGRWLTLRRVDIDRSEAWFEKRGSVAVFLARLVPGVRSLISIPAGVAKMNPLPFLIWTTAGSVLWTFLLAGAGYVLGARFRQVEVWLNPVSWVVAGVLVVWYVVRVIRHPSGSLGKGS